MPNMLLFQNLIGRPRLHLIRDAQYVQSCVKTFLLSFEIHSQNIPLPTPKVHHGAIFQPAIPETWQESFFTTLYLALYMVNVTWYIWKTFWLTCVPEIPPTSLLWPAAISRRRPLSESRGRRWWLVPGDHAASGEARCGHSLFSQLPVV